jgi:hypothetical protein
MHYIVYPRYFVTPLLGSDHDEKSDGDLEVVDLYAMYMNRFAKRDSWPFQERVLAVALRLFGPDFQNWLRLQNDNPKLRGMNLEFLNDTLRFIETGQRHVSYLSWIELMNEMDDGVSLPPQSQSSLLRPYKTKETAQVLQAWCRRPHGLDDLVCSLNAFFGSRRFQDKTQDRS